MSMKRIAALTAVALSAAVIGWAMPVLANDMYLGVGIGLSPGEPKYKQSQDLPVQIAFELSPQDWRFSFMQATFDSNDKPTVHINSQVFGVEKLFIYKFNEGFSLNGGLGFGWYQVDLSGAGSGTGSAAGLMATAGARYQINPQFFTDLQFQYRNAAVAINSTTVVDAGWNGFALSIGYTF